MSDPIHLCDLIIESKSCLPRLPPQAKFCDRFIRQYKKAFLPTWSHPLSHMFFKSSASLLAEKRRYIKHNNWLIIHPFSYFNIIREIFIFILWTGSFLYKPFLFCFIPVAHRRLTIHNNIVSVLDYVESWNILIYFVSAYYDLKTKVIELRMRYTIWNYLTTYFFTDFLFNAPFTIALFTNKLSTSLNEGFDRLLSFTKIFVCLVRIRTLFTYMRHITYRLKMNEQTHNFISISLTGAFILHWCTCLSVVMSRKTNDKDDFISNKLRSKLYMDSFSLVLCHFLRAGVSMIYTNVTNTKQFLTLTLIMFISYGYHVYIMARALQMTASTNVSETQYEEMLNQLRHYLLQKKLPVNLSNSILEYFDRRYQRQYFHMDGIKSVLSGHLNNEVTLAGCKHLLKSSTLFHGLTRYDVGRIISLLTMDIMLKNEVICMIGDSADYCYLISYGTVALFDGQGVELCHIEDGDLIYESDREFYTQEAIAVEYTELYRIKRKDFEYCMEFVPNFAESVAALISERKCLISKVNDQKTFSKETSNILIQLERGRILDNFINRLKLMLSPKDIA